MDYSPGNGSGAGDTGPRPEFSGRGRPGFWCRDWPSRQSSSSGPRFQSRGQALLRIAFSEPRHFPVLQSQNRDSGTVTQIHTETNNIPSPDRARFPFRFPSLHSPARTTTARSAPDPDFPGQNRHFAFISGPDFSFPSRNPDRRPHFQAHVPDPIPDFSFHFRPFYSSDRTMNESRPRDTAFSCIFHCR